MDNTNISKKASESSVPVWAKYALTIPESAEYFGIGEKKIRQLICNNPQASFFLKVGVKTLVKRQAFEQYLTDSEYI